MCPIQDENIFWKSGHIRPHKNMVRLKFCNDFIMLESSYPWEWWQTLFRLKLKPLLPLKWLTFIIQKWYQSINLNMVCKLYISTHKKKNHWFLIYLQIRQICSCTKITSACHTIISKEKVMVNLDYLNHLLQFIHHNPEFNQYLNH